MHVVIELEAARRARAGSGTVTDSAVHSSLEGALPSAERIGEARARLEDAGVRYVLSCWIDIAGIPKTKPVPLSEFEELCAGRGPQFAAHSVSMVPELGAADPDQIMVPDLDSLVVCPWDHTYAWVFADLYWCDEPYAVCPRGALKRHVRAAADAGYAFYAGVEPEFIVMRYDDDGRPVKAFDEIPPGDDPFIAKRQAFGYDVEFSLDAMPFLDDVASMLAELGWGLTNVVAEGAYSQFELDFGYADVLTAADRLTFLRVLLKEAAKRHGFFVTYMAKPTQGDWRSGAHINHSARAIDGEGGNLFKGKDGAWGDVALHALGGMMAHAPAITAVTCPTVNSYKGLIKLARGFEGGTVTWAPTHVAYGRNNRSAMFRLPQARFAIENRAADMSMNAYLAMAMTVGASLAGIDKRLDPGPGIHVDLYTLDDAELAAAGAHRLPTTLQEAVAAFASDTLARDVLGPTMHDSYVRYKRDEWDRFHEHVTEWELTEYLRFF
jgi:glutamine synthetase